MYIVIQNEPFKVTTFETKSDLANYLEIHRNTITNKFNTKDFWQSDKGVVYQSNKHYKRFRKGNTDSFNVKKAKSNGEIELKRPKLYKG